MSVRVEILGTAEFRATAAKLRAAGKGALVREMAKKMRAAAKPAVTAAQQSIRSVDSEGVRGGGGQQRRAFTERTAGKRGPLSEAAKRRAFRNRGLRNSIARSIKPKVKTGARSAGLQIKTDVKRMPYAQRTLPGHMNTGKWRHPVFGDREVWVTQRATPPGWFDRPMRTWGPRIRNEAMSVVDEINRQIAN